MTELGPVVDRPDAGRFELTLDGHVAYSEYELRDGVIVFQHTESPPELRGRGVGSALARGVLDAARARGLRVVPHCEFIAGYIASHPEYQDLLVDPQG